MREGKLQLILAWVSDAREEVVLSELPDMTENRNVSTIKTVMRFLKSEKTKKFPVKPLITVASFILNKAVTFITAIVGFCVVRTISALKKIFKAAKQAGPRKTLYAIAAMLGFCLALYLSFWLVFVSAFLPYGGPSQLWLLFKVFVAEVLLTFLAMPAVRILPLKWLKKMSPLQTFIISFLIVIYPVYAFALYLAGIAILV